MGWDCENLLDACFRPRGIRPSDRSASRRAPNGQSAILTNKGSFTFPRCTTSKGPTRSPFEVVDGVGFKPTRPLRVCRFSRPVPSTARPPIRLARSNTEVCVHWQQNETCRRKATLPLPRLRRPERHSRNVLHLRWALSCVAGKHEIDKLRFGRVCVGNGRRGARFGAQ